MAKECGGCRQRAATRKRRPAVQEFYLKDVSTIFVGHVASAFFMVGGHHQVDLPASITKDGFYRARLHWYPEDTEEDKLEDNSQGKLTCVKRISRKEVRQRCMVKKLLRMFELDEDGFLAEMQC